MTDAPQPDLDPATGNAHTRHGSRRGAAFGRLAKASRDLIREAITNRAVRYYFAAKSWLLVGTLVTTGIVITVLPPQAQGYWYTMLSLLVFQIVAEFGFNSVLIQFISHEWARLRIEDGRVTGDLVAQGRLASILRFAGAWIALVVVTAILVVGTAGFFILRSQDTTSSVEWRGPWIALVGAFPLSMVGTVLRSLSEGRLRVDLSQKAALWASVGSNIAAWAALAGGAGLYALAIMQGLQGVLTVLLLVRQNWGVLLLARNKPGSHRVSWHGEIWRQQWRIGLSWLCGLAVYQSMTPILFALQGPVVAGQFGLLMQVYMFAGALAQAWLTEAQPRMGGLWAHHDIGALRSLVRTVTRRSLATAALAVIVAIGGVLALKLGWPRLGGRFPGMAEVALLLAVCVAVQPMAAETSAVRFSKREPFLVAAAVTSVCTLLVLIFAAQVSTLWMVVGYAVTAGGILSLWCHHIYLREMAKAEAQLRT